MVPSTLEEVAAPVEITQEVPLPASLSLHEQQTIICREGLAACAFSF
jgi:hypothetical protein